jgi:Transposase DDE domain
VGTPLGGPPPDLARLDRLLGAASGGGAEPLGLPRTRRRGGQHAPENQRGSWHKKHKETGEIPHPSIDTEAGWAKSGWHGWWYGWQLHLAVSVGSVWSPLAAELTTANTADTTVAPRLLAPLPAEVRDVLGDTHDNDPEVRTRCEQSHRALVATRRGGSPHHDDGVDVRRLFHKLRSQAIEPCNGLCKNVFEWRTQMPVKGLRRSQLLALGAMVIYQLVLL